VYTIQLILVGLPTTLENRQSKDDHLFLVLIIFVAKEGRKRTKTLMNSLCTVHGLATITLGSIEKNVELPYSLHFHPSSSEIGSKVVNIRNPFRQISA
jgi:hypothetical protein